MLNSNFRIQFSDFPDEDDPEWNHESADISDEESGASSSGT
jgi:hypothetical protein